MNKNIYLSSGKFAELCGTTKETLRHYHNKGLLVPAKQEDNGYFYYTVSQCLIFELIQLLSNTGNSLQQIKEYLNDYSIDNFSILMENSYQNLIKRKNEIDCMMRVIKNSMNCIEENKSKETGIIFVEKCECEYFWSFNIEPILYEDLSAFSQAVYKFRKYNKENNFIGEFFYTCFMEKEDFLTKNYHINGIAVKTDLLEKCISVKPEGFYVVLYHKGKPETIKNSLDKLNLFLKEHDLSIYETIYQTDIINNQITQNEDDYVVKISVHLQDDKNLRLYLNKR